MAGRLPNIDDIESGAEAVVEPSSLPAPYCLAQYPVAVKHLGKTNILVLLFACLGRLLAKLAIEPR